MSELAETREFLGGIHPPRTGHALDSTGETGLRMHMDKREFNVDGEAVPFKLIRSVGVLQGNWRPKCRQKGEFFKTLSLYGEIGAVKAEEYSGREGELGPEVAIGVDLNLFEKGEVLPSHRDLHQSAVSLRVAAERRDSRSNFHEEKFQWEQTTLRPYIRHVRSGLENDVWHWYSPTAVTLDGGFNLVADGSATLGEKEMNLSRDFGLFLQSSFSTWSGVDIVLGTNWYAQDDREFYLGVRWGWRGKEGT